MASLVAGAFLGAAFGRVLGLVETYIKEQWQYETKSNVKELLKQLKDNLTKVQAYVAAAETLMEAKEPNLLKWLSELKNVIYDAEYVMGVFEYHRLKKENEVTGWRQAREVRDSTCVFFKRLVLKDKKFNKLSQVVKKLDDVINRMHCFAYILKLNKARKNKVPQRETTSDPVDINLFGIDEQQEELLELLQQSSTGRKENYSVVSIVGIGGIGKTTLAQSIYEHKSLKEHFDVRAWVYVSSNFDIKKLLRSIAEAAEIEKPADFYNRRTLQGIQNVIKKGLQSKKFLIVLDDIWEDMKDKWETVSVPLRCGKEGSKILVTSRSCSIAKQMGAQENSQIYLRPLKFEKYWEFFQTWAFGEVQRDQNLIDTGKEIAKKLGGLPLAGKMVGKQLNSNLESRHWESVLKYQKWKENTVLMSSLKLSYDNLDEDLKKCFLYCTLFPKGYRYNSKTLADIWITLDCVPSTDRDKRLDDIENKHIPELVNNCFLREDEDYNYMTHDLLHDLAESFVGNVVCRVEDDTPLPEEAQCNVRHLYVRSTKSLESVLQNIAPKQLRSLVYVANEGEIAEGRKLKLKLSSRTIKKLKGLCLLFFYFDQFHLQKEIHIWEDLGALEHLRCINFNSGKSKIIVPSSFWELYLLEILKGPHEVTNCSRLDKLINLRCVHCTCSSNDPMITASCLGYLKVLKVVQSSS